MITAVVPSVEQSIPQLGGRYGGNWSSCSTTDTTPKDKQVMSLQVKKPIVDHFVSFLEKDMEGVQTPRQDALIISAWIIRFDVRKVTVEIGSSTDIIFNYAYENMAPKLQNKLKPHDHNLYNFNNQPVWDRGIITLTMELGNGDNVTIYDVEFLAINCWSPYNSILG